MKRGAARHIRGGPKYERGNRSMSATKRKYPTEMEAGREGSVSEDGDVTGSAFTSWRLRKGSHLARHLIALAQDSFNRGKAH